MLSQGTVAGAAHHPHAYLRVRENFGTEAGKQALKKVKAFTEWCTSKVKFTDRKTAMMARVSF